MATVHGERHYFDVVILCNLEGCVGRRIVDDNHFVGDLSSLRRY